MSEALHNALDFLAKDMAEFIDSFDLYCVQNMDQVLSLFYSKGYNQHDNEGLGGLEQYENESKFAIYPGETLFYHLLLINRNKEIKEVKP